MYSFPSCFFPAFALILLSALASVLPLEAQAQQTITYEVSEGRIANQERGFYHYIETRSSQPNIYELNALRSFRQDEDITLLYCINYLDTFVSDSISSAFLDHFDANMNTVREAGLKCILRFAYTDDDPTTRNEEPPFGDASKEQILVHITQLGPLLSKHADVIATLQAGFIGVWGEWYYTDHFVDNPSVPWDISEAQQARRLEIVEALLAHLPESHQVAVRYPHAKQGMLQRDTPILAEEGFSGTALARIGFHNDCFLAGEQDFGTYRNDEDRQYLAEESKYVALGGETCQNNPPRSSCENALQELQQFHWTYLNMDYHPQVLSAWRTGGCMDEIEKKIGYRLTLKRGTYPDRIPVGDSFSLQFEIENTGWAAPIKNRPFYLVATNAASGERYRAALPAQLQTWESGALLSLDYDICTSSAIPPGEYALALYLPDPLIEDQYQENYALRFANQNLWDEVNGINRLNHILRVEQGQGSCTGPILLGPDEVATNIDASPPGEQGLSWTVFPNPTSGSVHVKWAQGKERSNEVTIEVFDILGRLVIKKQPYQAAALGAILDLDDVGPGMYVIRLSTPDQHSIQLVSVLQE